MKDSDDSLYIVLGCISAVISLFFFPPLFGIAGVVCGIKVKDGEWSGFVILGSIVCMIIGLFWGTSIILKN